MFIPSNTINNWLIELIPHTLKVCVLSGARAVTAQSVMRHKIINLTTSQRGGPGRIPGNSP